MSDTNKQPDNPPAFPRSEGGEGSFSLPQSGMTLRDWFAGQADVSVYNPLETLRAKLGRSPLMEELAAYVADIRRIEADAMLAAREKGQS